MAQPKGDREPKLLHLDGIVIKDLSKMAIDSPQKNFKNFAEHILTEKSKEGKRSKSK